MPIKTVKGNIDVLSPSLFIYVNDLICQSNFLHNLRFIDLMPVYKKEFRHDRKNYRPVSTLPNLSKVYQNIRFKKLSEFFENTFTNNQAVFRKGFSGQHFLVSMIEKKEEIFPTKEAQCSFTLQTFKSFWLCLSGFIDSKAQCIWF